MAIPPSPDPGDFTVPDALPVLPLRDVVLPLTVVPLALGQPRSVRLVKDVMRGTRLFVLVAQRDAKAEPATPGALHRMGTVGMVHQLARGADGSVRLVVQGLERVRLLGFVSAEPYLVARVQAAPEPGMRSTEVAALLQPVLDMFRRLAAASPDLPAELAGAVETVTDPRHLLYFVASVLPLDVAARQELLEMDGIPSKLGRVADLLGREVAVRELDRRIAEDHVAELRRRIESGGLPQEAWREVERELTRLATVPRLSPEHGSIITYLEWMVSLPWTKLAGHTIDVGRAREVLNEDHLGLENVKDRILEYLTAKRVLTAPFDPSWVTGDRPTREPILCLVGPSGVGKSSLGRSIARALGRRFVRTSLGGVRDEAEVRGHRRTHARPVPGRIMQGLRRAATRDPVFMLDEVDRIGGSLPGDPVAALLEVLDPDRNATFVDNYVGVAFDLSQVLFIATAHSLDTVPPPLLDRMEVLTLSGYTEEEKIAIAHRHLIPKQLAAHGIAPDELTADPEALRQIVRQYAHEAGVRGLEREIAWAARHRSTALVLGVAGRLRAARVRGVSASAGGAGGSTTLCREIAEQLRAVWDGVPALGRDVVRQYRVAGAHAAAAVVREAANQLHATQHRATTLRREAAAELHAAREGTAAVGRRVGNHLRAARETGAAFGLGVVRQLCAVGAHAAALGGGIAHQLRVTRDGAAAWGRGVDGQLRAARDRVAALGGGVARELRATRDGAAAWGRGLGSQLRATRDRVSALGGGVVRELRATRAGAAAVGRGGAGQLRAAVDRGAALGRGAVRQGRAAMAHAAAVVRGAGGQLRAARDRGAALGRDAVRQYRVARAGAAAVGRGVADELRARSLGARVAWSERPALRPAGSLAAWCRGYSWRGRPRARMARAGATAFVVVSVLVLGLPKRTHEPPPDSRTATSSQATARPPSPAAPVPARVMPAPPDPARPPPRPRRPESVALATARGQGASRTDFVASSPTVGRPDSARDRALLDAAAAGELTAVRHLLASGASPGVRDPEGRTALMVATVHGRDRVAELLLDRGADVNAGDDEGVTALMVAARDGEVTLVQRFLDRGAVVDARTRAGWTALTYAARTGHPDVARRLLRAGADPTLTDRSGWSALMYATWRAAESNPAERSATADTLHMKDLASVDVARRRYGELVSLLSGAAKRR